ncbi:hypothetical protein D3C76_191110 [compost metagenome]
MKTYGEIKRILIDKRLPAPWFLLDELTERDELIKQLNQQLTEKDATITGLRKSYEEALDLLVSNQPHAAGIILSSALGEGDPNGS